MVWSGRTNERYASCVFTGENERMVLPYVRDVTLVVSSSSVYYASIYKYSVAV